MGDYITAKTPRREGFSVIVKYAINHSLAVTPAEAGVAKKIPM